MTRTITNHTEFRSNVCAKFKALLNCTDENSDIYKVSLNLEKATFNYAIKECRNRKIICKWDNPSFVQIYIDHLRSIYINLQNPHIYDAVKSLTLTPKDFVFMTHQEMNPERWESLIKAKMIRDENKFNAKIEASTDMFTCPKSTCKSKRCTYYQMQTRSADEPMTIFITCLDCGKNFKRC